MPYQSILLPCHEETSQCFDHVYGGVIQVLQVRLNQFVQTDPERSRVPDVRVPAGRLHWQAEVRRRESEVKPRHELRVRSGIPTLAAVITGASIHIRHHIAAVIPVMRFLVSLRFTPCSAFRRCCLARSHFARSCRINSRRCGLVSGLLHC